MTINTGTLRGLRSSDEALDVLRQLGYEAPVLPFDSSTLGLEGRAIRLRSHPSPSHGFGVLVANVPSLPPSLRTVGRRLVETLHDQPLAILGIGPDPADWSSAVVVRPRLIEGGAGAVQIAKLTIDPARPTAHDAAVVNGLAWSSDDSHQSQRRIDEALDVERVTRRFYQGVAQHQRTITAAVAAAGATRPAIGADILNAGGGERVGLRIVTQILFCYFLQKKGLLEGVPDWLTRQFRALREARTSGYYQRILEPLFYEALSQPIDERPDPWRERTRIPFLNGGLFERQYLTSLPLPDNAFDADTGLLGFLDGWTFTVSEEAADEHEVAVDPEMLGKVFENLVSDEEKKTEGTVYTPRPVVQFMAREALVHYLQRAAGVDEETARLLLTADDALGTLSPVEAAAMARRIDQAAAEIRVLDPAVGSGAFPLGMLTELVRLRRLARRAISRREPSPGELWDWKLNAVERSLYGVDINPAAVELCRLRLWLALLVEEERGDVHPLPNLEYRIVCADSLTDFVRGVEVQQTRRGPLTMGIGMPDPRRLIGLRERYFEASQPAVKGELRERLATVEDELVEGIFREATSAAVQNEGSGRAQVRRLGQAASAGVAEMRARYGSRDRAFPLFVPMFHAPEVIASDGWDVVIMNPPYVGRKEVAQRFDASRISDLEQHYGRTYDLMIHFAFRALELARPGGVISMIFNDSIFTSADADQLRRRLLAGADRDTRLLVCARSRPFEYAVNGGVIVAALEPPRPGAIRWVENHDRPTADLAGASIDRAIADDPTPIGRSELWSVPASEYERLPHRPLFRPSPAARRLLDIFERTAGWSEFGRYASSGAGASWTMLAETRALERWKRDAELAGFYDRLRPGEDFILLGLVVEGGQGLATADDRRFLAAIEGTAEAAAAVANRERLVALTMAHAGGARLFRERTAKGATAEAALVAVGDAFRPEELKWPRIGVFRAAPADQVRRERLSPAEVERGITNGPSFVPFEKGDTSAEGGGGAKWRRDNPIVIDWSTEAVALLRRRARQEESYRKPRLQNEKLWGQGGVTWNRIASYVRTRRVEDGSIFSDKAPTVRPHVNWLTRESLLSLMNAPIFDFTVRTFLGSRMQVEFGDIRGVPVPVLTSEQSVDFDALGRRAVAAKEAQDRGEAGESLGSIEAELDRYTRDLYGIAYDAELWVVR